MKTIRHSVLALLTLVVAVSMAAQQNPPGQEGGGRGERGMGGPPPVVGTITSVGVDRFEIKKTDGTAQTVMVNDQTRYRQRQQGQQPQELHLEDLKAGDHVAIRGTPNGDKLTATGVNRISDEMFQRIQSGGGPGGPGGPGGAMEGTRAGGEIVSIEGNQIKVRSRRGGDRTIVVNDQTAFTKEGQSVGLKDLKVGDRIFAMGKEENGQFLATEVHSGRPGGGPGGGPGPQN